MNTNTQDNRNEKEMPPVGASGNHALLDRVNSTGAWFHARKIRPIWARRVTEPLQITTLEGLQQVPIGAFLCRGEAGDVWPQAAERLHERYIATGELSDDGWTKYEPRPEVPGVWAAKIEQPFMVEANWGRLQGKAGDYLVKDYSDGDVAYPTELWIVDAALFAATYK